MKKKDLAIILAAAVLGLALLIVSKSGLIQLSAPGSQQAREGLRVTMRLSGQGEEEAQELPLMTRDASRRPAESYLRVTVGRSVYEPLPLDQDFELSIRQGEAQYNLAKVQQGVVQMVSASCPKHECIQQGSLSLDNRDLRAMQSSIICLPNQVVLELLDERQASAYYGESQ